MTASSDNIGDLKYGLALAAFAGVFWCVVAPFTTPLSFAGIIGVGIGLAVFSGISVVVKRKATRGARAAGTRARERKPRVR